MPFGDCVSPSMDIGCVQAAMRDQYILPHWKLSSSLKECGEQICLESISNERLEEQLASSFQVMVGFA